MRRPNLLGVNVKEIKEGGENISTKMCEEEGQYMIFKKQLLPLVGDGVVLYLGEWHWRAPDIQLHKK